MRAAKRGPATPEPVSVGPLADRDCRGPVPRAAPAEGAAEAAEWTLSGRRSHACCRGLTAQGEFGGDPHRGLAPPLDQLRRRCVDVLVSHQWIEPMSRSIMRRSASQSPQAHASLIASATPSSTKVIRRRRSRRPVVPREAALARSHDRLRNGERPPQAPPPLHDSSDPDWPYAGGQTSGVPLHWLDG